MATGSQLQPTDRLAAPEKDAAIVALFRDTPWGDIGNALLGVEIALSLLMEATRDDFHAWLEASEREYLDEFALTKGQIAALSAERRRGYVAQLIRDIALDIGVATELGGRVGQPRDDRDSLGYLDPTYLWRGMTQETAPTGDGE